MNLKKITVSLSLTLTTFFCLAAMAQANELVNALVSRLEVSQDQAMGGAGAIFRTAKDRLAPEEFKEITSSVQGVNTLIKAAPEVTGQASGGMGLLTSIAKQASPEAGAAAELVQSFNELGLNKDMIGKFGNVIMDYCRENGSAIASQLIQKALGL